MRAQKKLSTKDTKWGTQVFRCKAKIRKSTKKITTTSQGFVRVFSWTDEVLK